MAGDTKPKAKRDPMTAPARVLIEAVINALVADVERSEIISSLKFARGATGYKAQVWRAAADALNTEAAAAGQTGPAQSDVELRGPGS